VNSCHPIARFVEGFFHNDLAAQKGLSSNTILSYKDALKLFLHFCSQELHRPVDKLVLEDFEEKLVVQFLNDLETSRWNSIRTRNSRLAALHGFFRYVARQEPPLMARCQRICAIPLKRSEHKAIEYLEDAELRALLDGIDQNARSGLRDYALLLFLYNTGARVQEAVDLKIDDLRLESPFQVKLTGKGRKERVCPLWPETVAALKNYLNQRAPDVSKVPAVFINARGEPITRFGIRHIVGRSTAKAKEPCPSLKSKKVSPHTLRHTTAMHLLQSGNDITVVKDWLGHADVQTTHGYVEIDLKMKRKALEACKAPEAETPPKRRANWRKPGILQWLDDLSRKVKIMCSDGQGPAASKQVKALTSG